MSIVFVGVRRVALGLIFLGVGILSLKPASAQNLDGFYIGIHGGWMTSGADIELQNSQSGITPMVLYGDNVPREIDTDANNFMGGIQAGVSTQANGLLMGIEGDFSWTDIDDRKIVNLPGGGTGPGFAGPGDPSTATVSTELQWLATLRLWAGMRAAPTLMLYLTGGAAFADIENRMSLVLSPASAGDFRGSEDDVAVGWTIGGGGEWTFGPDWSVKAEYLYYDLQDTNVTIRDPDLADSGITYDFDNTGHILRVGLNYSFTRDSQSPLK